MRSGLSVEPKDRIERRRSGHDTSQIFGNFGSLGEQDKEAGGPSKSSRSPRQVIAPVVKGLHFRVVTPAAFHREA